MIVTVDLGDWRPSDTQVGMLRVAASGFWVDTHYEQGRLASLTELIERGLLNRFAKITPLGKAVLRAVREDAP